MKDKMSLRVTSDWAGQAGGPAVSAMPRWRRSPRKRRPVGKGQQETFERLFDYVVCGDD